MSLQKEDKGISGCRTTKRLLGSILVDGGFVSSQDLETALELQKQNNEQLGEILVRMGVLGPVDLKAVLSIQKDLTTRDRAVNIAAGVRLLLGDILIKAKRITQAQIDYALMEQRQTGEKLGETLIRLGLLKEHELDAALSFQRNQVGDASVSEKLRLGELLVATGQVTRRQLDDVLERQRVSKKKIGELLVEAGYVQPHQVAQGLKLQQQLVTAALVTALSLSNLFGANEAYAASGGTSAKVTFTATVREQTSMQVLNQKQELVVTNADIARGYVEVSAATRISVKTNNPAGYLLAFEAVGMLPFLESTHVIVGGREVQISPAGGWIPQPYVRGGVTQSVNYRFSLSKDAHPGTYAWPLMISAMAR